MAVILVGGLASVAPARAQEADTVRLTLDSLVVEALRLPTAAADAPFALTVVGEDHTRRARAGRGLAEALHGVPGLQVSDRSNDALGERVVIRGAGARAAFGVRGVRVLIDGLPATLPDGQTDLSRLDMATIGRVEVLRGSASSLYGNASGGVLRISSAAPPDATLAPQAEAMSGSDGLLRLHARVAGTPVAGWYDASFTHRELDGFREHSQSAKQFVRAAGGFPLAGGELALQANALSYDARNPGSLADSVMAENRRQAHAFNVTQRAGESARQTLAGATWWGPLGVGTLELALYGTLRSLDNPIPVSIIELERAAGGARAVYGVGSDAVAPRAAGPRLLFGIELDAQRDERRNYENAAGEKGITTLDQLERVRALGLLVHGRLPLGTRADASAGLRYDRFRFAVDDNLTDDDPDDSGARDMSSLSPSLAMHARLARAFHVFASVATAFETPTTTELANRPDGAGGFNPGLEPQRTFSLEAGARGDGAPLRYELAVFHAHVIDALVPFEAPSAPGRRFFRNAGSAVHTGAEAAVGVQFPRGFGASVSWSWIDARFDEFTVDSTSFAGNRVPGIAPHRVDAALTSSASTWLVALEASWAAAVPVNDANTEEAQPWSVLDARAEWRPPLPHAADVRLFGGVRNLLDQEFVGSVVVNAFGGRFYEPAPGRSMYLGVRAGLQ